MLVSLNFFSSAVEEMVSPSVVMLLLERLVPLELGFVSEPFSTGVGASWMTGSRLEADSAAGASLLGERIGADEVAAWPPLCSVFPK